MDTVPVRHLPGTDTAPGVFYLCLELVPRVLHVAAAEDERGGSAAKRRKVLHDYEPPPAAARPPLALNPQPLMMPEILRVIFCYCDTATLVCCGAVCRTVRFARRKFFLARNIRFCLLAFQRPQNLKFPAFFHIIRFSGCKRWWSTQNCGSVWPSSTLRRYSSRGQILPTAPVDRTQ